MIIKYKNENLFFSKSVKQLERYIGNMRNEWKKGIWKLHKEYPALPGLLNNQL